MHRQAPPPQNSPSQESPSQESSRQEPSSQESGQALAKAPAVVFYPTLLIWSIVYGAPAGVLFKLLSVIENWQATNRYHLLLWKKYPKRSYQKYISGIWASEIRDKPVELAEYTRQQVEKSHPAEPFPFGKIALNTLLMLLVAPFMMVSGLILGPSYVFKRGLSSRRKIHNKIT